MNRGNLELRFFQKIQYNPDTECWEWTGYRCRQGYGRIGVGSSVPRLAHRVGYRLFVGPIPEGLELDHLCRVKHCVNPAHLEPVTPTVNVRRHHAQRDPKTHCVHGHEYTEANSYIDPKGVRHCRRCNVAAQVRYQERKQRSGVEASS